VNESPSPLTGGSYPTFHVVPCPRRRPFSDPNCHVARHDGVDDDGGGGGGTWRRTYVQDQVKESRTCEARKSTTAPASIPRTPGGAWESRDDCRRSSNRDEGVGCPPTCRRSTYIGVVVAGSSASRERPCNQNTRRRQAVRSSVVGRPEEANVFGCKPPTGSFGTFSSAGPGRVGSCGPGRAAALRVRGGVHHPMATNPLGLPDVLDMESEEAACPRTGDRLGLCFAYLLRPFFLLLLASWFVQFAGECWRTALDLCGQRQPGLGSAHV
jgi:hypothetical protein